MTELDLTEEFGAMAENFAALIPEAVDGSALIRIEEKLDGVLNTSPGFPVTPVTTTSNTPTRQSSTARVKFNQVQGMCAQTGKILRGIDHLRQSVRDIILTPHLQRVMLREYGMDDGYLDYPGNKRNIMKLYARLADALDRWEPRLKLTSLSVAAEADGQLNFSFAGDYLGEQVQFGVAA